MTRVAPAVWRIMVISAASLVAGCVPPVRPTDYQPPVELPPGAEPRLDLSAIDQRQLLADRIRIHPLTRVTRDAEGQPQLIVHVEMRDRFGQQVKAFGELRIELYRIDAGSSGQESVWSIDLIDPQQNAAYFDDLVSRTYQIRIRRLPSWMIDWFAGETDDSPRVKAYFRTIDLEGRERVLYDTHRLEDDAG